MSSTQNPNPPFPIDLIYLWVDGNDPKWREKKMKYTGEQTNITKQVATDARWRNNDELRYSLRSVEMYAPWINHIYIITDNQCPEWIDTSNPRISIVDHKDILPHDALPVFNSSAIESCLYKIPGLSEHFIVGNDDTLFVKPVEWHLFFTEDGRPIVRLNRYNRIKWVRRGNYTRMLWHMQELVKEKFGKMIPYAPHHNFDAYRKSDFEYCVSLYKEQWEQTAYHRFRQDDDMHRSFVSYYLVATKRGVFRRTGRYNRIYGLWNHIKAMITNRFAYDSRCIRLDKLNYDTVMQKYNPLMVCMNDNERSTDADCQRMVEFLKVRFPDKSSFEK